MVLIQKITTILVFALLLISCDPNLAKQHSKPIQKKAIKASPINNISAPNNQNELKIIQKKVKIAALLPLSGKNKELGTALFNSITLSLFENDKNNDIELVVLDSDDLKKAAIEVASQNITIIIGPIFSVDVEAFLSLVKDKNISLLSLSNNQELSGKKGVFLMGFLPEQQIERASSYAISEGKDNFAIIAPNNQYGQKLSAILKNTVKRKDGNFISGELYSDSTRDLERAVSKVLSSYILAPYAKNKNPAKEVNKFYANTIFIPEAGTALSKIISLIHKYNVGDREIQLIGSSNWDDASTLNNPSLDGGWLASPAPEKYHDFEKRYYQIYNKFPPRVSSISYDAAIAVIEFIKKSGKRELSAEDFINYQSPKNGFIGLDGLFRFLPNGIVQRNFAILKIRGGKFEMIDSPSSMFFKY